MGLLDWLLDVPAPVLKGPGLLLRPPRTGDFEEWRTLRAASRTFLAPWEPLWAADELTRKSYVARLARYRHDARQRTSYSFFLFDDATGALCGGITLGLIRRGVAQTGTLGYWMGEAFAGQGRMSRAVQTVAAFAFDVEKLHRIEAACLPRNERSIALLEKCGFSCEGQLRRYLMIAGVWEDHRLYARLADDADRTGGERVSNGLPDLERKAYPVIHG